MVSPPFWFHCKASLADCKLHCQRLFHIRIADLPVLPSHGLVPDHRRLPPKVFKLAHLLTSAGVALALAGGIESGDSNNSNDASGRNLERIAIILFVVLYIFLCMVEVVSFVFRSRILDSERPIFLATSVSLPLLAPRLLFALLASYKVDETIFSSLSQGHTAVVMSAIFVTLPEFIIAAIILRAGFKVQSLAMRKRQMEQNTTKGLEA